MLPRLNKVCETASTHLNVVLFASSSHLSTMKEWVEAGKLKAPIALLKSESHLRDYAFLARLTDLPSYPYAYIVTCNGDVCFIGTLDSVWFKRTIQQSLAACDLPSANLSSNPSSATTPGIESSHTREHSSSNTGTASEVFRWSNTTLALAPVLTLKKPMPILCCLPSGLFIYPIVIIARRRPTFPTRSPCFSVRLGEFICSSRLRNR